MKRVEYPVAVRSSLEARERYRFLSIKKTNSNKSLLFYFFSNFLSTLLFFRILITLFMQLLALQVCDPFNFTLFCFSKDSRLLKINTTN